MSHINISVELATELSVYTVNGILLPNSLYSAYMDFYKGNPTKYLLWDLSNTDMCKITGDDIKQIVTDTKEYGYLRPNGKTAFVAERDLNFGIGRQYSALGEVFEHPIKIASFRVYDKAMEWLLGDN